GASASNGRHHRGSGRGGVQPGAGHGWPDRDCGGSGGERRSGEEVCGRSNLNVENGTMEREKRTRDQQKQSRDRRNPLLQNPWVGLLGFLGGLCAIAFSVFAIIRWGPMS